MVPQFLSIEFAAERLNVSKWTVISWLKAGKLRSYKIGHQNKLLEKDLLEFVNEHPASKKRNPQ